MNENDNVSVEVDNESNDSTSEVDNSSIEDEIISDATEGSATSECEVDQKLSDEKSEKVEEEEEEEIAISCITASLCTLKQ